MSYARVLPRDLFNEADLLKCYGRLTVILDNWSSPVAHFNTDRLGQAFDVQQDSASGALTIANVILLVRGVPVDLHRPLNSRNPWPLYLTSPLSDPDLEVKVFDDFGDLSAEMVEYLNR